MLIWVPVVRGVERESTGSNPPSHILTWERYDCVPGKVMPGDVPLILDGKPIGNMTDAYDSLKAMKVGPKTRIRIVYPKDTKFGVPHHTPPYAISGLLPQWYWQGAQLEFYHEGQKLDFRIYWWDIVSNEGLSREDFEFYLDGMPLGRGAAAQARLAKVDWGLHPKLMVFMFDSSQAPFRSKPKWGWPTDQAYDHGIEGDASLARSKVSIECYAVEPEGKSMIALPVKPTSPK